MVKTGETELASRISYSASMVAMIEGLRRVPSLDLAQRCDEVFGTPGTFARLQEHARTTPLPGWFRPYAEIGGQHGPSSKVHSRSLGHVLKRFLPVTTSDSMVAEVANRQESRGHAQDNGPRRGVGT